jgi:hypothetical protein
MNSRPKTPAALAGCGCLSLIFSALLFTAAFFTGGGISAPTDPESEAMVTYTNSREGRSGVLAENYVDFEFQYPRSWKVKPQEADSVNFVAVERDDDGRTLENLNVGYFQTAGTPERNEMLYPQLIEQLRGSFAGQFPELQKLSEGKTTVAGLSAYEGLFSAKIPDRSADVFIRVILLPTPDGTKGVAFLMIGTSFAPELKSASDLGTKGELPRVLETFRFR